MMQFQVMNSGNENMSTCWGHGIYKQTAALSGVEIISSSDNWSGTMYVYGHK